MALYTCADLSKKCFAEMEKSIEIQIYYAHSYPLCVRLKAFQPSSLLVSRNGEVQISQRMPTICVCVFSRPRRAPLHTYRVRAFVSKLYFYRKSITSDAMPRSGWKSWNEETENISLDWVLMFCPNPPTCETIRFVTFFVRNSCLKRRMREADLPIDLEVHSVNGLPSFRFIAHSISSFCLPTRLELTV